MCFTDSVFSIKMKVCGKQVCQHYFSNSICSVHISVSAFGSSCNISDVFIICYGDLWAVAFDVTVVMLRGSTVDCTHIRWQPVDVGCVLTVPITRQSLIFLPFLGPPFSLKHNNIAVEPINNSTVASKCSSKRKSHISLTWNQKIKLSEESMSKTKTGWKLGLLYQTVSQAMKAKEKFLKEIEVLLQWTPE